MDAAGNAVTSAAIISGIDKASTNVMKFFYNSVYIGGTGITSGAANTFAFRRTGSAADTVRNNIFMNERSNATTGGKHYAVSLNNNTSLSSDYNIIRSADTASYIISGVTSYPDLMAWRTASNQDNNSIDGDPAFRMPVGSASTTDLHLSQTLPSAAESKGVEISITDDFDAVGSRVGPYPLTGQVNGGGLAPDIGADEGDYILLTIKVDDIIAANGVILYPNPAKDFITVKGNWNSQGVITLWNALGQELQRSEVNIDKEVVININNLAEGVYFIMVQNEGTSWTGKFVKE
jgi:hypothetical protein